MIGAFCLLHGGSGYVFRLLRLGGGCVSWLLRWVGGGFFACAAGAPARRATSREGPRGCQSVCMGDAGGGCGRGWVFWACSVTYGKQPVGLDAITASGVLMWLLWLAMQVRRLGCVILVKQDIKTNIWYSPAVTPALSASAVTPVTASDDRGGVKALFLASTASNSTFMPSTNLSSRTFSAPCAFASHIMDLLATERDATAPPAPQPHSWSTPRTKCGTSKLVRW